MPEQAIKAFGEAIRQARSEMRLSQQDLSDLTGISKRHIAKIENGIAKPSLEIVAILASSLSISVDKVLANSTGADDDEISARFALTVAPCSLKQKETILRIVKEIVSDFCKNRQR